MIEIILNGERTNIESDITIADLVKKYQLDINKIAIEKDLEIINPDQFDKIKLTSNCQIEIVHFIGGG
ncbi:MAG: sulfur carrier protein ThiS [Alphaproteobacteria bacterium]